jgi:tRNA U55 pseudouridine synthase TruB
MSALRRTEAGAFSVRDAVTIAEVQRLRDAGEIEGRLLPADTLFSREMACTATEKQAKRIRCGSEYSTELPDGVYRVYDQNGAFLMLGRAEAGVMKTLKNFFEV